MSEEETVEEQPQKKTTISEADVAFYNQFIEHYKALKDLDFSDAVKCAMVTMVLKRK